MPEKEPTKQPKKITVDKEYFDVVNKAIEDIGKNMVEMRDDIRTIKQMPSPEAVKGTTQAVFLSQEYFFNAPKTPEEKAVLDQKVIAFRKELATLMGKYKVGHVQAYFLFKL